MEIYTGYWFTKLPPHMIKVCVSRGIPRGQSDFVRYSDLNPGPWFNSVQPEEYIYRYTNEILGKLEPSQVLSEIDRKSQGRVPVLVCWESVADIMSGAKWCHRHMAAAWIEKNTGIVVPEFGAPASFDPFRKLKLMGIEPPSF